MSTKSMRGCVFAVVLLTSAVRLDAAMGFRKQLTIDNARVSGTADLFGLPVLVSLQSDPDLQANVVSSNGFDIQFRAADGIQILSHEIERYDPATGTLVAWVRIPQLRFNVDTIFYIYYGDAGVTSPLESPESLWDRLYSGVWHLAEDPSTVAPQVSDSSFFGNHGTSGGTMTTTDQVAGKIGGALDFDGLDDIVDAGSAAILDDLGPLTVSAWIRPRTAGGSNAGKIVAKRGATAPGRWFLEIDDSTPEANAFEFNKDFISGEVSRTSSDNAVSYGAWQYVTATWDGSGTSTNIRILKNGAEVSYQSSVDATPPRDTDAAYSFYLGNRFGGAYGLDGLLDEVRVSRVVRSDGWIQTSFNNQNDPTKPAGCAGTGFICVGTASVLAAPFAEVGGSAGLNTTGVKDGGLAWGDFNNDTCLDVVVNTDDAAIRSRLYLQGNSGSCTGTFTDVTACLAPGLTNATRERSAIWGDINNDGLLDFARNTSTVNIEIYLNNGPGTDCSGWSLFGAGGTPSQILDGTSLQPFQFNAEGLGFMDYDADGDLDLMSDQDGGISMFQNNAGTFTYVATPALPATQAGNSDYSAVADIDVDGDVDILDRRGASPDLFLNNANDGTFTAGTFDESAKNANKGGIAPCDFDDDGDFDLFWTDAGVNQVWEQTGIGSANYVARGVPGGILGDIDGVACGDVDNDGDLDLMLTSDGNDQLFRNDGAFTFTDISPPGFGVNDGEATAFGDYDQDGDVDILINQDGTNELWQNATNNNGYLVIRALHDMGGTERDAIGATIRLLDCGLSAVSGVREVNGGRGHGSQDPAYVHMGLNGGRLTGPNSTYVAEVRFIGGAVVRKSLAPADIGGYQLLVIRDTDSDNFGACTTAVDLVSFAAEPGDGSVMLEWETGSEFDNLGFNVYRSSTETGPFVRINTSLIPGLGSSPSGARYRFADRGLSNDTAYFYELEDIETTGTLERHGPISATPRDGLALPPDSAPLIERAGELPARIVYGDPNVTSLTVRRRGARHLDLDLRVSGFLATPLEDGTVHVEIPGFAMDDEIALPVERTWVQALAAGDVEVVSVRASDVASFSLQPGSASSHLVASRSGTVRLERSARLARAFAQDTLTPRYASRILEVAMLRDQRKALVELAPLRWDPSSGRLLMARTLRVRLRFRGSLVETDANSVTREHVHDESHESRRVIAQLATREHGLHAVAFEDVAGGGRRSFRTKSLRLSRQGESVAFHVEPNPRRFGPGSTLLFVGDGEAVNPFGNEAVYELERSAKGQRMPVVSTSFDAVAPVDVYRQRIEGEENRLYAATLVDAVDPWLWDSVFGGSTKRFDFQVSRIDPRSSARLSMWLQGGTDFPASPDHHVRLWVNGTWVGEDSWNAKRPREVHIDIPAGVLHDGNNVLDLENVGDTAAAYSMVLVDRWQLEYTRALDGVVERFEGSFDGSGRATLAGLGSGSYVVDVTESLPSWLKVDNSAGVTFQATAGHRYVASNAGSLMRPRVVQPIASRLKNTLNQADYIVIGPSELVVGARPLLTHRQSQGLNVRAVSLEEIESEFGYGESGPGAIRSFLSYAYHHWQQPSPRYVLLLGDGSYDFKNYLGLRPGRHELPPFMVKTEFLWTSSDPTYAAVNGDDRVPDLAIGRLPAASLSELDAMVAKIISYETRSDDDVSRGGPIVLVADDSDDAGNFEHDADVLAATTLAGQSVEKIYLSHLGASPARARILDRFDSGASLVSYMGHGGINVWANEGLLRSPDVSSLMPQPDQPIVLSMNCLNGYFHFPYFDSLSEVLLKAEGKGAIATFSPSGLSLHEPASRFHSTIVDELLHGGHARLGDALLEAQVKFAETGARNELLHVYQLMGDPALVLRAKR